MKKSALNTTGLIQLSLFDDPRDKALEQALNDMEQLEWYQDPIHRFMDGGGLWWHIHIQGVIVDGREIDLEYCREWMKRPHKGWNDQAEIKMKEQAWVLSHAHLSR